MIERFSEGKLLWLALKNPTTEEVQEVMGETSFPPALMSDLTMPVPKSTAVAHDGAIKLTMDFPVVKRIDVDHPYEVKFLIAKHTLITVQYEEMEAIDRFKKEFEVISTLHKTSKHTTAGHLFMGLMHELYAACAAKLDYVESKLADIESKIFEENEKQMVVEIALVSKKLIAFRHILRTHDDIFKDAGPLFAEQYKNTFAHELEVIHDTYLTLLRRSNTLFETLTALRETNTAMLTTKQNEIMKILTIMAFVTFPLSLFTSTFGMNTTFTPIVGHPLDFWIIVGIMVIATVFFFIFFKYKRWM